MTGFLHGFKLFSYVRGYHVKIRTRYAVTDNDIAISQASAHTSCLLYFSIDYNHDNRNPTCFIHDFKLLSYVPRDSCQNKNNVRCYW